MTLIQPEILSLVQHINVLHVAPQTYRPDSCPGCQHAVVWNHGCYTRQPGCSDLTEQSLSPVLILRFYCPSCHSTCSVLPECIPPRSWYLSRVRQAILLHLLAGNSIRSAVTCKTENSNPTKPACNTIKRWWNRFKDSFALYSSSLCAMFPCLGRYAGFKEFWKVLFALRPLSSAMRLLHDEGIYIP